MSETLTSANASTIPTTKAARQKLLRRLPGLLYRLSKRRRLHSGLLSETFANPLRSAKYRAAIEAEIERREREQIHASSIGRKRAVVNV